MKTKNLFIAIVTLIFVIILNLFNVSYAATTPSNIAAESYILMDNATNKILCGKNENQKMYPASTTKILTAIIVLEHCNLDDVVTASYNAVMSIPDGYSKADIEINEQLTVEQLLELLLVHSANDAANVLAEFVGGSIDSFVSIMNTKLLDLGLKDTHFTNAFGMHDENHYTTAHDMALLFKYCLQNDTFRRISGKASCAIPATNLHEPRTYISTNELLVPESNNYYKYLTAGKTGYTSEAKRCLVSSAYRDDIELIGVILGSDNNFIDMHNLFEYGYSNFSLIPIVHEHDVITTIQVPKAKYDSKNLDLLVSEEIITLASNDFSIKDLSPEIYLNDNIEAPIEEGTTLGKVVYNVDNNTYTADLIASHSVEESKLLTYALYFSLGIIILLLIYRIVFYKRFKNKGI